jgi:hypothetical protein
MEGKCDVTHPVIDDASPPNPIQFVARFIPNTHPNSPGSSINTGPFVRLTLERVEGF